MISKLLTAGAFVAVAITSFAPASYAAGAAASRVDKDGGFYGTPIQKGAPRDLPGEQAIPGVNAAVDIIDGVTRPILVDPIQSVGAGLVIPGLAPAAAPAVASSKPARHHHHHHHHHVVHVHHHHHHH